MIYLIALLCVAVVIAVLVTRNNVKSDIEFLTGCTEEFKQKYINRHYSGISLKYAASRIMNKNK